WQVDTGKRDAPELGSAYYEVRFEALVSKPEETLREVVDFLEVPFDPQMLTYYLGRTRTKPGLDTNKAWLPPTPGVRDWHAQLSAHDVELVEALAGDLLSELAYERAFKKISPPLKAEAKHYRKRWARKVARRAASAQT